MPPKAAAKEAKAADKTKQTTKIKVATDILFYMLLKSVSSITNSINLFQSFLQNVEDKTFGLKVS